MKTFELTWTDSKTGRTETCVIEAASWEDAYIATPEIGESYPWADEVSMPEEVNVP